MQAHAQSALSSAVTTSTGPIALVQAPPSRWCGERRARLAQTLLMNFNLGCEAVSAVFKDQKARKKLVIFKRPGTYPPSEAVPYLYLHQEHLVARPLHAHISLAALLFHCAFHPLGQIRNKPSVVSCYVR